MTPSLLVRPLTIADLPAVLAIEAVSFPHPWSETLFLDELARGGITRARALEEREGEGGAWTLRGYLLAWLIEDEFHINNLAVDPGRRGRGLAAFLLRAALAEAAGEGARAAMLEVRSGNAPALALYAREGFCVAGLRQGYYQDGEDALLLTLELR